MAAREPLRIKQATEDDVPLILTFIRELAEYEKLLDSVSATEERLRATLFGPRPYAEAVVAYEGDEPAAFAIYFFNYSSFTGLPGLYIEDILVRPASRRLGAGRKLIAFLARTALERGCAQMEWAVLNWNEPAIRFYKKLAAQPRQEWTVFRLPNEKMNQLAKEASL